MFPLFGNIHWKTRARLVCEAVNKEASEKMKGKRNAYIPLVQMGFCYLNTTVSLADRQTGSEGLGVGVCVCGWGGVSCTEMSVVLSHRVTAKGLNSSIKTSVGDPQLFCTFT